MTEKVGARVGSGKCLLKRVLTDGAKSEVEAAGVRVRVRGGAAGHALQQRRLGSVGISDAARPAALLRAQMGRGARSQQEGVDVQEEGDAHSV